MPQLPLTKLKHAPSTKEGKGETINNIFYVHSLLS